MNDIGLLNTTLQKNMFATGSMIKNIKIKNIEDGIKQVKNIYLQRGFKITRIRSDSEFEHLQLEIVDLGIYLNCASKKEHVPDIERCNRIFKKLVQYAQAAIPFNLISKLMIVHPVTIAMFWINAFPPLKPGAGFSITKVTRKTCPWN